jgi:hypothetical protein
MKEMIHHLVGIERFFGRHLSASDTRTVVTMPSRGNLINLRCKCRNFWRIFGIKTTDRRLR